LPKPVPNLGQLGLDYVSTASSRRARINANFWLQANSFTGFTFPMVRWCVNHGVPLDPFPQ